MGLLLDGGGADLDADQAGGAGQDVSVVPKGMVGAQLYLL